MDRRDELTPVLYLAPWVDFGGTDTATIDWFRTIDRDRFAPLLVSTQPSANRRLREIEPYAQEIWALPEMLAGNQMPGLILDLIHSRGVGIVHVMNARIGFESLIDFTALPRPPKVVVQLHGEEQDRSGYARLVTSRFGNLVDCFSVVSHDLAQATQDYGIPPERVRTIPLGVDAVERFNPELVEPVRGLEPDRTHVLFIGRLVEQKDPTLMLDVVARLAATAAPVLVHVVGDGELEAPLRERAAADGLQNHVRFHAPTADTAPWYAGCDLVLMTSRYEGVPCVLYEAMAMGRPVVAPALAGNVELVTPATGVLIEPRDDADTYAGAIGELAAHKSKREAMGKAARDRVLEHFSLQRMADEHAALYDDLLQPDRTADGRPTSRRPTIDAGSIRPPLLFPGRKLDEDPLVSVIVPCFNQGRYLHSCLRSILDQDYPHTEVIVVDDASTEASTLKTVEMAKSEFDVTVLLRPEKAGPSAARNQGVAHSRGRYVLPVDADDMLAPGAIASMAEQLRHADERVGFIYPTCQFFGTRDELFQPPRWNLYLLTQANYCASACLIDRTVFDVGGLRWPEDIGIGHEDWDFVLTLASRGVAGEPARQTTLLYRRAGFSRSTSVEYSNEDFAATISARHPALYGEPLSDEGSDRRRATAIELKSQWAPALSILLCGRNPSDTALEERLQAACSRQSCHDFELVRPQAAAGASRLERLQSALRPARGRYVLGGGEELAAMLDDPAFVERVLRTMLANRSLEAIAFTDAAALGCAAYTLLRDGEVAAPAHALLWASEIEQRLPQALRLSESRPFESLAAAMSIGEIQLQWRHAVGAETDDDADLGLSWFEPHVRIGNLDPHEHAERRALLELPPALPALAPGTVRRWQDLVSWTPPETLLLCRHVKLDGTRRVLSIRREPPPGYALERELGAIHRFAPPGTGRLVLAGDAPKIVPRGSERCEAEVELGHIDLQELPLQIALERARLRDGSVTLLAGADDSLRSSAVDVERLGYIEGYPNLPRDPPDARQHGHGLVGLLRCVDQRARRHRYLLAGPADPTLANNRLQLVGEVGALALIATPSSIEVRIDSTGTVRTDSHRPAPKAASAKQVVRWVGAPAGWSDFGDRRLRARAIADRAAHAISVARADGGARPTLGAVRGYLHDQAGVGRVEIFAAFHPVTGDQLLTRSRLEAADMGYGEAISLGFALATPVCDPEGHMRRVGILWASRLGLRVRQT